MDGKVKTCALTQILEWGHASQTDRSNHFLDTARFTRRRNPPSLRTTAVNNSVDPTPPKPTGPATGKKFCEPEPNSLHTVFVMFVSRVVCKTICKLSTKKLHVAAKPSLILPHRFGAHSFGCSCGFCSTTVPQSQQPEEVDSLIKKNEALEEEIELLRSRMHTNYSTISQLSPEDPDIAQLCKNNIEWSTREITRDPDFLKKINEQQRPKYL